MLWYEFLERVHGAAVSEPQSRARLRNVQYDSRRVGRRDVFVAMRGGTTDGNRFVEAAVAQGAAGVVTDSKDTFARLAAAGTAAILVPHGRRALSEAASALLGAPEKKLAVSAITGTNGKTTTAYLLEQLLTMAGRKCVLIGTVQTRIAGKSQKSEHTTPEPSDLLRIFADGVKAGCTEVVMEMSSHALAQERVWGVPVDVGVFTNLTQDHLDFHGSMQSYFDAKARLFEGVGAPAPRVAVWNVDDAYGMRIGAMLSARTQPMAYGARDGVAAYCAEEVTPSASGTKFRFVTPDGCAAIESPLIGGINVSNLLAAMCAALARGLTLEEIAATVPRLRAAPGRFEVVGASREAGFTVVVDYAHTDDALRNVVAIGREQVRGRVGRVITVFGCGGDRDRTKRPKMGLAAGEESDLVVVTSDNPRSEDPASIIREILPGMRSTKAHIVVEENREKAIRAAIGAAEPGDIVIIAGKGHEKVQIVGGEELPFDDVAVAGAALRQRIQEGKP